NEVYSLGSVEAKFVKVVFNGNNHDDKVTISRVEFYHNNYDTQEEPGPGEDPWDNPTEPEKKEINNLPIILGTLFGAFGIAILAGVVVVIIKRRKRK
ncbi:hypothetical protein HDR67_00370, partial [bacterium]|nr:hypothetical protein [bacterium]